MCEIRNSHVFPVQTSSSLVSGEITWFFFVKSISTRDFFVGWWFGHEFYDFPYIIGNVIIPTDEVRFFRGVGQPPIPVFFWPKPPCPWVQQPSTTAFQEQLPPAAPLPALIRATPGESAAKLSFFLTPQEAWAQVLGAVAMGWDDGGWFQWDYPLIN